MSLYYVLLAVASSSFYLLLMDPPSMRVEWRCITMVNGVQCVMMIGISMMHKLCVDNWALAQQLLPEVKHIATMNRVVITKFNKIMQTCVVSTI